MISVKSTANFFHKFFYAFLYRRGNFLDIPVPSVQAAYLNEAALLCKMQSPQPEP